MREFYEVLPDAGDAGGWRVTRNGLMLKWWADQIDAVLDAVERAFNEAEAGTRTSLRIKGRDGRIEQERMYPREPRPAAPPESPLSGNSRPD